MSSAIAAGVVGAVVGGVIASKGAGDAADTQAAAADRATQIEQQMYDQTREDFTGYRDIGEQANPLLQGYVTGPDTQGDRYTSDMTFLEFARQMDPDGQIPREDLRAKYGRMVERKQPGATSPDLLRSQGFVDQLGQMDPTINANLDPSRNAMQALGAFDPNVSVDYEAIKNDPMYQFAMQEALKGQNKNLSAQNMLQSRAGADAIADTGMRVALNERDRIYGQNVDNYGRAYGQGTDQYNMQNALAQQQYGVDTGNYQRGYGQLQDQASLGNQLGGQQYSRLMGLSGIGQNAAGQMAQNNQSLASGLSSNYMNQGNALAQSQLAQGQIYGSMAANAGSALGYGINQYNQQQQQPASSPYMTAANPLGLTPGQGL